VEITRRQSELLTYLAVHPHGAHRDTLTDTLWPQARSHRRANGLHSMLGRLCELLDEATGSARAMPITAAT
jgi:DNA-binding SARP family transcriptional activator